VDELAEWKMQGGAELARWKARNPQGGEPVFLGKHRRLRHQSAANVARRLKTSTASANRKRMSRENAVTIE
jgi:hypothetical protein